MAEPDLVNVQLPLKTQQIGLNSQLKPPPPPSSSAKRRKSCLNCQERKAKCVPSSSLYGSCSWCSENSKECLYPDPDLKKRRKTTQRSEKRKINQPPRALDVPPLQALQGPVNYVEDSSPSFIPKNYDTVAYLGFSGDLDPHLMQYYKYDENHVASFFNCSARQMQDDPSFPVQFLAFADNRGKAVRDEIAEQRERLKELTRGTEDRLLRLFFRLVYPTYPIVDRKKFYADYSRGSENIDICLYSGLLAISVIWNKYDEELCVKNLPRQLYDKLFDECSIAVERSLKHPTLGTVQGLLLLAQKHIIQSDNATLFSVNLHMAKLISVSHTLGLHLDCSNWSISESEKRLRKRIWATIFMVEKWSSANLGLPSVLQDENSTWGEYSEEDPSSSLFVHFGKLTRILGGILKDLYSVRNYADRYRDAPNTIAKVDKYFVALQFWRDELPPELKDMSYIQENELKRNGILHLAELTIAVLLHRIKLHPSCTNLLDRHTLHKYRLQASTIIQRVVKYTSEIDNPHLKSFWHSMVRLNFSTLLSFVLFHHITSTSKKEYEETKLVLNKWSKTLQGLSKSWAGGTGLAVERASTVFLSGDTEKLFGHENGLVKYTQDTDRLNEEAIKREEEEMLEKEKQYNAVTSGENGEEGGDFDYESSTSSEAVEKLETESPFFPVNVNDLDVPLPAQYQHQQQSHDQTFEEFQFEHDMNFDSNDHQNPHSHHNLDFVVPDGYSLNFDTPPPPSSSQTHQRHDDGDDCLVPENQLQLHENENDLSPYISHFQQHDQQPQQQHNHPNQHHYHDRNSSVNGNHNSVEFPSFWDLDDNR